MATKKATPKRGGNRGAKTEKVDSANVTNGGTFGNSDPVRQLIRCQDDVLLYELSQGKAYEVVSPIGECWRFSLRYQAESKFERVVSGMPNGRKEEEGHGQH
jgi:hypothetical protein